MTWQARSEHPLVFSAEEGFNPVVRLATPDIGWQFHVPTAPDERGRLFSTTDAGRTWREEPTDVAVVALEAQGRSVWRLERRCSTLAPCRYTLRTSNDYGRHWSLPPAQPPLRDGGAFLVRPSATVAYVLSDHTQEDNEQPGKPMLARTTNGGRSWSTLRLPCGGYRGGGEDLAASLPMDLWFVCYDEPGSGAMAPKHLYRSRDGGVHWSEDLGTPNIGAGGSTAAGSPERACRGASRTGITCTRDGGHTWFAPIPDGAENPGGGGVVLLEFADESHAYAIGQDIDSGGFDVLWRTADGGESWSPTAVGSDRGRMWVIPYSGPVGTEVTITGQNCHDAGSTHAYLVFQSVLGRGTDRADDIGEVTVDTRTGRFETRYRIPVDLHGMQRDRGGPTAPGDYEVASKPPSCRARFTVMERSRS